MRVLVEGKPGSGKTTKLREIADKEGFEFLTSIDYRRKLYSLMDVTLLSYIERDYVLYLIYQQGMKNYYRNFTSFLDDAYEFFMFIFNVPFWIEEIKSSNEAFNEFLHLYTTSYSKLNNENIFDNYTYLKNLYGTKRDVKISKGIAVDDIDFLNIKEIMWIKQINDFAVSYREKPLFFDVSFDVVISLDRNFHNKKWKTLFVENKYAYFVQNITSQDNAFLVTRRSRVFLEKFTDLPLNQDIRDLILYLAHLKYGIKYEDKPPSLYNKLLKISNILNFSDSCILDFMLDYESILFYKMKNVFSSPLLLLNSYYKKVFVEDSFLRNNTNLIRFENKLFPYDFFEPSFLIEADFRKEKILDFLLSKADEVYVVREDNKKRTSFDNYSDLISLSDEKLETISYSQVSLYDLCPYRYKLKYVNKLREEKKPFFVFGNIVHEILEKHLRGEIKSEYLDKILRDKLLEEIELFKDNVEEYYAKGKEIFEQFLRKNREVFGDYDTVGVERKISLVLNDRMLVGYIDRVVRNKEGLIELIDYKTTPIIKNQKTTIENALKQLSLYAYLYEIETGERVSKVHVWLLSHNKILSFSPDKSFISDFLKHVEDVIEKTKRGEFPPKPSSLCRYCDYKMICKYWRYYKQ